MTKKYYQENREKILQARKLKYNGVVKRAYNKKYYKENKGKIYENAKEYRKQWAKNNPEKLKATRQRNSVSQALRNKKYDIKKKIDWAARKLCTTCGTSAPEDTKKTCKICIIRAVARYKKRHKETKEIIFNYYGRVCKCCGETNLQFLTIDHINNDGGKQRKENKQTLMKIARVLPSDLQILCFNCNYGKRINKGICPHLN